MNPPNFTCETDCCGTGGTCGRPSGKCERGWRDFLNTRGGTNRIPDPLKRPPEIKALEEELARMLGTRVALTYRNGRGSLRIDYHSLEEFERLYERLIGS